MISDTNSSNSDQRFKFLLIAIASLCAVAGFVYWQVSREDAPSSVLAYQRLAPPSKSILESVAATAGVAFDPSTLPSLPANHPATGNASSSLPSVGEMAGRLRARLEVEGGGSVQGWFLLGRTYMELKQYDEAVAAFDRAREMAPDEPGIMVSLADALSMQADGAYDDKARRMIERAISLNPADQNARWMAGNIAIQQGDPASALAIWRDLLPELEDSRRDQLSLQIATVDARVSGSAAAMKVVREM